MTYIYAIQHNVTKKIYIGKSKNVYKRYEQHLSALRNKKHSSVEMQNDFDEYGADFSIFILEEVKNDKERILLNGNERSRGVIAEVKWIKKYDTINTGYNGQDAVSKRIIRTDGRIFPIKEGLPEVLDE